MDHSAYAVMCDCQSVGKRFSGSKRKVAWKFTFAEDRNRVHEVILKHSIISGKREITMDGNPVHVSRKLNMKTDFDFPFNCPGHLMRVSIKELVDRFVYSLFIDNVPFRHLPHNSEQTSSRVSKNAKSKSKVSGGWDPFAEVSSPKPARKNGSSAKKSSGKKKKAAVKKKKSTSDWVSFTNDDDASSDVKKSDSGLLDDIFSTGTASTAPPAPGAGTSESSGDIFSNAMTDTSANASLSDISSLYAAPVNTSGPSPMIKKTLTSPVRKQNSWGGLVDLNNIASPAAPEPKANTFGFAGTSSPAMPMYSSPMTNMNMSPGMRPPRGYTNHNTTPTFNARAATEMRRQAAKNAPASAFEADPFARFS
eukprot:g1479.t1